MAKMDHITTLIADEAFTVNGCGTLSCNEAEHYLAGAHAVLAVFTTLADSGTDMPNEHVLRSALGAVSTLLELGMWQMHHDSVVRGIA